MKKTRPAAAMAVVLAGAVLASAGAQAQTKQVQAWQPTQQEPDPARRVPQAQAEQQAPVPAVQQQAYAQPQAEEASEGYEEGRGGFFIGVQAGKGWVQDDVDQSARAIDAGYRWQAGAVSLIGVEVARGRLDDTTDDGLPYGKVDYTSIGANARFNFGRTSPVYGLVRAGYWSADNDANDEADGGYFGLGLGVDIGRHFNLSLVYTNYVYFNDVDGDGVQYEDVNRADTLMLGAEARF